MNKKSHYHFNETAKVEYGTMKKWVTDIFSATGMQEKEAELVADTLVDSDARGVYSHGVQRVKIYTTRIRKGCVNTEGKPRIVVDNDAIAVVDGDNSMGQITGVFAMEEAIRKGKEHGTSFVTARGGNHYGRCEYYTRMALEHNMIGISATIGGGNLMAPWGGTAARVGNNPFSIAMPTKDHYPVVLDMAQSVVAKGKIEMALKTGSPIPLEWALDKNGNPTTDPAEGVNGSVRPIADYKGSGIAIMVGFLCSILSEAACGPTLRNVYKDFDAGLNKGQLFAAIDISRFLDIDVFKERMDKEVDFIKSAPLAENAERIFLPGEIEYRNFDIQSKEGIVYATEIIKELKEISQEVGADIPAEFI